ncbi:MAG: ChaN family lipoprotein, partial [Oxalobacter sp.]|nr:ChaN family lipoprotein [Oxalobacter sp.]
MSKIRQTVPHPRASWIDPVSREILPFQPLMQKMAQKSIVMLGETHDVAEIHRWQLHVAMSLYTLRPHMMMAFEMFPRRIQPVLDEWVDGLLDTETFIRQSEWYDVWGFPAEIYLPLFHFCRQQKIRMIAANCYRELVTRVGKEGWDAVPESERDGLTPSAPPTDAYRTYLSGYRKPGTPPPEGDRFIRAQQTWDRAFACNMAYALDSMGADEPMPLIIGIIGRGHLEYGHGTPYQLADLGITDTAVLLTSDRDEWQEWHPNPTGMP